MLGQAIPYTTGMFRPANRRIGAIVAQVTIEEQERDELTITEHPVEQGAPISDHAFKRPSEVTIRAGWSMAVAGDLSANGGGIYGQLLQWQAALQPFDLVTGKRTYKDMLIQSLMVTTDQHSEFALMAEIHCKQVIIVKTQVTQAAIASNPGDQADPGSNATPANKGDQQTSDVGSTNPDTAGANVTGGVVTGEQFGPPNTDASSYDPKATQIEKTVTNNTTSEQMNAKGYTGNQAGMVIPITPPNQIISP